MENEKTEDDPFAGLAEQLSTRVGDLLGELDALSASDHNPEMRLKVLAHAATIAELRRHNVQLEGDARESQTKVMGTMEQVADCLRGLVKHLNERIAPPGSETVRYRGMGLQLQFSGKPGDAHFDTLQQVARTMADSHGKLTQVSAATDERERFQHLAERSARRRVEDAVNLAIESTQSLTGPLDPKDARSFLVGLRTQLEAAFDGAAQDPVDFDDATAG